MSDKKLVQKRVFFEPTTRKYYVKINNKKIYLNLNQAKEVFMAKKKLPKKMQQKFDNFLLQKQQKKNLKAPRGKQGRIGRFSQNQIRQQLENDQRNKQLSEVMIENLKAQQKLYEQSGKQDKAELLAKKIKKLDKTINKINFLDELIKQNLSKVIQPDNNESEIKKKIIESVNQQNHSGERIGINRNPLQQLQQQREKGLFLEDSQISDISDDLSNVNKKKGLEIVSVSEKKKFENLKDKEKYRKILDNIENKFKEMKKKEKIFDHNIIKDIKKSGENLKVNIFRKNPQFKKNENQPEFKDSENTQYKILLKYIKPRDFVNLHKIQKKYPELLKDKPALLQNLAKIRQLEIQDAEKKFDKLQLSNQESQFTESYSESDEKPPEKQRQQQQSDQSGQSEEEKIQSDDENAKMLSDYEGLGVIYDEYKKQQQNVPFTLDKVLTLLNLSENLNEFDYDIQPVVEIDEKLEIPDENTEIMIYVFLQKPLKEQKTNHYSILIFNRIKNEFVYFDSYGEQSEILKNNLEQIKKLAKQIDPENKIKFKMNSVQIQQNDEKTAIENDENMCGSYIYIFAEKYLDSDNLFDFKYASNFDVLTKEQQKLLQKINPFSELKFDDNGEKEYKFKYI